MSIFIVGFFAIVAVCIAVWFKSSSSIPEQKIQPVVLNGFTVKDRSYAEVNIREIKRFSVYYSVTRIYADRKYIWCVDSDDQVINEYTLAGEFNKRYGRKGDAPWENSSIWYFRKETNGYVVIDRPKKMIKVYDESDSLIRYHKSNEYLGNGIMLNEKSILTTDDENGDFEFQLINIAPVKSDSLKKYSIKKSIIDTYNEFPRKNIDMVFEGAFTGNNKFSVYYFHKFGMITAFDSSFNVLFSATTIDGTKLPKPISLEVAKDTYIETVDPDNFVNYAAAMDYKHIYVLSNVIQTSQRGSRVLDVYSIKNGKYVTSVVINKLEDGQSPIDVTWAFDNFFVILYENMTIRVVHIQFDNDKPIL